MSVIDSMVPFLLGERVISCAAAWYVEAAVRGSVHLEVTADEELTRHDCGVVWGVVGDGGIELVYEVKLKLLIVE